MTTLGERPVFPFTALVGQEQMKRALLLNAISPQIGGVLIRGEKGTAKSTAVRALTALLPEIDMVLGCPYSCDPDSSTHICPNCAAQIALGEVLSRTRRRVRIVELPVGATEDRVVGTLDLERAIQKGERHFEPGLLARANRGVLYIDEVNLLNDHLVDVLLDAAAMGVNTVEREGVSFSHPARFILIGTMNPEEGELRPQLLDRFGLAVEIGGVSDPEARMEVVRRRIAFESDPKGLCQEWQAAEEEERERIQRAQALLPQVVLEEEMLRLIAHVCLEFAVDGLRADIVMYKTAHTLAAYAGRTRVTEEDVRRAAELVLLHRRRRQPFEKPQFDPDKLEQVIRQHCPPPKGPDGDAAPSSARSTACQSKEPERAEGQQEVDGGAAELEEQVFSVGVPFAVRPISTPLRDQMEREGRGRRSTTCSVPGVGRYVEARIPQAAPRDLALDATLRAAAPYQQGRRAAGGALATTGFILLPSDLREKVRETKTGNLILFVVDASGSMGVERRMVATKGAILSLLLDAYQRRDQVGLITFRSEQATLVLSPTNSVEQAERFLRELPTGGRTPLSRGLLLAANTLVQHQGLHREVVPLLVLISDGRANVALREGEDPVTEAKAMADKIHRQGIRSLVIDTEKGFLRFGLAQEICAALGGKYVRLEELAADAMVRTVRQSLAAGSH